MAIIWTETAYEDLDRLYAFLAAVNPRAAAEAIEALIAGPEELLLTPLIGQALPKYLPQHVRRYLVGSYEVRYEIVNQDILILTIWHQREKR
jgi:plasmid stabilization system protein ParE